MVFVKFVISDVQGAWEQLLFVLLVQLVDFYSTVLVGTFALALWLIILVPTFAHKDISK